jgi:hypothetical protein
MKQYKINILFFIISFLLVCLSYSIYLNHKLKDELERLKIKNELIDSYFYEHSKIPDGRQ